jgi:hypothetical protein
MKGIEGKGIGMIGRVHGLIFMAILFSTIASPIMANPFEPLGEKQALEKMDNNAKEANEFGKIYIDAIASPLERWVLLRKGETLCAVRFTAFRHERAMNNLPPSTTRDSFFASYEWFYQSDGSGGLSKSNVKAGQGEASKKPNLWRFERGTPFIKCGSLKVQWDYPNFIFLINRNYGIAYDPKISDQPNDIEVALTGWKNISDVNPQDPRLVWHRYDPQRDLPHINDKPTIVPVGKLPGFD